MQPVRAVEGVANLPPVALRQRHVSCASEGIVLRREDHCNGQAAMSAMRSSYFARILSSHHVGFRISTAARIRRSCVSSVVNCPTVATCFESSLPHCESGD